ncbi:MAG TPA: hypothetical protein DCX25_04745 [Candidatus Pacebacteria bacterium]|nr:MAG: hypothetical protein UX00_C0007G0105 [Microgenomates group bacterium GW2011_GWB1_45_17]KKU23366.1 MAG: hypothetical protein UX35_C0006G0042 [Microgenomates group bacterium GW2011_GWA1_46_15]KKU24504.1 MAG: hypothetical protein UX36_C0001G0121 [Microgenomates group bacterium GW2011_GWC1_46_15]HAV15608.1 hypothetical protein [Candidatus Paceibacterota bacterium]HCR11071.1 hypothetical protein [Candidatus Paceibacterota bacterium]
MADTSGIVRWIELLKQQGKTEEEIQNALMDLKNMSSLNVYTTLAITFTEDELKQIESITDDQGAEKKVEEMFLAKTGMSIADLVKSVQDGVAGHAVQQLQKKS